MERKSYVRTCIIILILVFTMFSCNAAQNFQMEWNETNIAGETWVKINMSTLYEEPIVVAIPEYQTTTEALGVSTWITNITRTDFMLKVTNEDRTCSDNIDVNYIVMEKGSWLLPGSSIRVEANNLSSNVVGSQSNGWGCPSDGNSVSFLTSFTNNPIVLSTRTSDNNPNSWAATYQVGSSSSTAVGTSSMCIALQQSKATSPGAITNDERLDWIAVEPGNGTLSSSEYEIDYPGASTRWVSGYPGPYTGTWSHTWSSPPIFGLTSQTAMNGGDGSWAVTYDVSNANYRLFVDEANERAHTTEQAGIWAFSSPGNIIVPNEVTWDLTSLHVGDPTINEGDESNIIGISSYKANNNAQVTCISGNCSQFSDDWIDGTNLAPFTTDIINFTCQDNPVGNYSAIYRINSTEDSSGDLLNVTCQVFKVYASLEVTMVNPDPSATLMIAQNRTFTLQARVDCVGDPGTHCSNITGTARYNEISLYGDGSDGSVTISTANTIVNNYTYLTGDELSGQTILTVNDATSFNTDDEILIIQMQNGTGNGEAGRYEFARIIGISGNDVTIKEPLNNSYYSGAFDVVNSEVTQIVRIPQYTDLTINAGSSITASAWNGYSGGIVIFRSQDYIDLDGEVNVDEKGYRGGNCGACGNNDWGTQGEGYLGVGTGTLTNNANGGGGGYGPSGVMGEPGAGGGYATAGGLGDSTNDATGGSVIGSTNLEKIFFGGGGGAGGDNDGGVPFPEYTDGGGVVMLFSPKIRNARISANGEDAFGPGGAGGVAGGGAGGTIWLAADDIELTSITATGGTSFNDGDDIGGAGGDGRIRMDYNIISGSSTPAIGYTGVASGGMGIMDSISTTFGDQPLWTSNSNPQNCGQLNESEYCILTWLINATGDINSSHIADVIFSSDIIKVRENITQNLTLNITANIIPLFTLISPTDNLKFVSNGIVGFNWSVSDDDSWVNCSLYINDIFNRSLNCSTSGMNNLTLNLTNGFYNWSITANDSDSNIGYSPVWDFILIKNVSSSVEKSISFESLNMYKIVILINTLNPITLFEWVINDFISGSRTPSEDFVNSTSNGDYIGWVSNKNVNHSISGVLGYRTRESYVIGID